MALDTVIISTHYTRPFPAAAAAAAAADDDDDDDDDDESKTKKQGKDSREGKLLIFINNNKWMLM